MGNSNKKSIGVTLETLELLSDLLGVGLSDMVDGKWDVDELKKYKENLSISDLYTIAKFRRLCKNYFKIQRIENKHGIRTNYNHIKEKNERRKPKEGEKYWYVSGEGKVIFCYHMDYNNYSIQRCKIGNYFKTKKQAKLIAKQFKEILRNG